MMWAQVDRDWGIARAFCWGCDCGSKVGVMDGKGVST